MKTVILTAAALVALAGPSFASESLAKQVERHFAQDETGHDAIVLPEVSNAIVMGSASRDLSENARQILATGDSWTDAYVPGTGTVFSAEVASDNVRFALDHFASSVDGTSEN